MEMTCDLNESNASRDGELDEVMEFLKFSVKRSTSFEGAITFLFRDEAGEINSAYTIDIDKKKVVQTTKLNKKQLSKTKSPRVVCEVTMSVDDFLWVYSGKASVSDVARLYYKGRLSVSGFAIRSVSNFASSFDFSSQKWIDFYAWRDQQALKQQKLLESCARDSLAQSALVLSREMWFHSCRSILAYTRRTQLQRLQWETSLASLFGEEFAYAQLCESVDKSKSQRMRHTRLAHRTHPDGQLDTSISVEAAQIQTLVLAVLGDLVAMGQRKKSALAVVPAAASPVEATMSLPSASNMLPKRKPTEVPAKGLRTLTPRPLSPQELEQQKLLELLGFRDDLYLTHIMEELRLIDGKSKKSTHVFDFLDDKYIDAVKNSGSHHNRQVQSKNRVDLLHVGFEQLGRLVDVVREQQEQLFVLPKITHTKGYVPAPERLLLGIRFRAKQAADFVKEKALGRKPVHKIPVHNVQWLIANNVSLTTLPTRGSGDQEAPAPFLTQLDRVQVQRKHSKREFETRKALWKRRINSLQRDLALQTAPSTEDLLSDYF